MVGRELSVAEFLCWLGLDIAGFSERRQQRTGYNTSIQFAVSMEIKKEAGHSQTQRQKCQYYVVEGGEPCNFDPSFIIAE
jgi:hypothetical protein